MNDLSLLQLSFIIWFILSSVRWWLPRKWILTYIRLHPFTYPSKNNLRNADDHLSTCHFKLLITKNESNLYIQVQNRLSSSFQLLRLQTTDRKITVTLIIFLGQIASQLLIFRSMNAHHLWSIPANVLQYKTCTYANMLQEILQCLSSSFTTNIQFHHASTVMCCNDGEYTCSYKYFTYGDTYIFFLSNAYNIHNLSSCFNAPSISYRIRSLITIIITASMACLHLLFNNIATYNIIVITTICHIIK